MRAILHSKELAQQGNDMSNETINPIHHSTLGAATSTAAGAVGGGLKGGVKTLLYTVAAGALIGAIWMSGGFGLLPAAASGVLGNIVGGSLLGGLAGTFVGAFAAPLGGLVGGLRGGSHAAARVRDEKGAANVLDAQLSAYQAQAQAMQQATTIYAPSAANNNSFPASTMNQAGSRIQADTAQNLGTVNGLALQRA